MNHVRRVVGHVSGWQEQMPTCVCGKDWPCPNTSPTASELNQGKELTEQKVRKMRDDAEMCYVQATAHGYSQDNWEWHKQIVALCDYWLSSRSSEAPSRRGEGDGIRRPVRIVDCGSGWCEILDSADKSVADCYIRENADAIVEALNKNTGAS